MRILVAFSLAALPCLAATASEAADVGARAPRTLTVTRVAAAECPPYPVIVARGRRGMGEPGSYYARWDYRPVCQIVYPY